MIQKAVIWTAALVLVPIVVYVVIPAFVKILLRKRFLAAVASSGRVCLTFDDGPDPTCTPKVLEILSKFNAPATFYVIGRRAEQYPDLLYEIAAAGHEIGEHTYSHTLAWTTGPIDAWYDLIHGSEAIHARLPGARPKTLRPPYGKMNSITLLYLLITGKRAAFWNLDPRDYARAHASDIVQAVSKNIRPGSVILLHDGRQSGQSSAKSTLDALPYILQICRDRNLPLATVSGANEASELPVFGQTAT